MGYKPASPRNACNQHGEASSKKKKTLNEGRRPMTLCRKRQLVHVGPIDRRLAGWLIDILVELAEVIACLVVSSCSRGITNRR